MAGSSLLVPAAAVIELFVIGRPVPVRRLLDELDKRAVQQLAATGVIVKAEDGAVASVGRLLLLPFLMLASGT